MRTVDVTVGIGADCRTCETLKMSDQRELCEYHEGVYDERARSDQWKREEMAVLAEWEKVYEALGSPGSLGQSRAAASLAKVQSMMEGTP